MRASDSFFLEQSPLIYFYIIPQVRRNTSAFLWFKFTKKKVQKEKKRQHSQTLFIKRSLSSTFALAVYHGVAVPPSNLFKWVFFFCLQYLKSIDILGLEGRRIKEQCLSTGLKGCSAMRSPGLAADISSLPEPMHVGS